MCISDCEPFFFFFCPYDWVSDPINNEWNKPKCRFPLISAYLIYALTTDLIKRNLWKHQTELPIAIKSQLRRYHPIIIESNICQYTQNELVLFPFPIFRFLTYKWLLGLASFLHIHWLKQIDN